MIDLHTHSRVSDGTQSPRALVREAACRQLHTIALTDHDTTAGWDDAAHEAGRLGIGLVRGMEISARSADGVSIHLLSYLHDPTDAALADEIARARASRVGRAQRIVDLLAVDVPITYDDVLAQVHDEGTTVGRPHIADALVANGVVRDRGEAFARYLHDGSPYYATHYTVDAVQAVRLVRAAGGVPVFAHPFATRRGRTVPDSLIEEMAAAGLAGVEVHHRDHSPAERAHGLDVARSLGLFVTGSSDYHGSGKPNQLAENTTEPQVLAAIEEQATGVPVVR